MKVSLIFPPVSPQFYMPYLSVPALGAYLKQEEPSWDVRMEDLNIALARRVMAPEGIALFKREFSRALKKQSNPDAGKWLADRLKELHKIESFLARYGDKWKVRRYKLDQPTRWFMAKKLKDIHKWLEEVLIRAVDVEYLSQEKTMEVVENYPEGLMTEYYRDEVVPRLVDFSPDLLGFSWVDHGQVIPTLILLKYLRKRGFRGRTVVGGPYISLIWDRLKNSPVRAAIDHFVYRQGEEPLLRLARSIASCKEEERASDTKLENMAFIEPEGADISVLPPPDFGDFPLEDYYDPEIRLCALGSWGCYWGKCSFCNVRKLEGVGFKSRTPAQIASDIHEIKKKYNPDNIRLSDNAISFSYLVKIARELLERKVNIPWITNTRFDGKWTREGVELLAQSNCNQLLFGLESASDDIIKLVDKGTDLDLVRHILSLLEPTRIWAHFYMIVGYPSETREDLGKTIDFFKDLSRRFPKLRFSTHLAYFGLEIQSHIYNHPGDYHIEKVDEPDPEGWSIYCKYHVETPYTDLMKDRSNFFWMKDRLDSVYQGHLKKQMTWKRRFLNRLWILRKKTAGWITDVPD